LCSCPYSRNVLVFALALVLVLVHVLVLVLVLVLGELAVSSVSYCCSPCERVSAWADEESAAMQTAEPL
jgi:hypothetical protein